MNTGKSKAPRTGLRAACRNARAATGATGGAGACLAPSLAMALGFAMALAGAGCLGGGQDRGNGKITVDIRPLVEQMGGSTGASTLSAGGGIAPQSGAAPRGAVAPQSITGPGTSAATTDVLTLVIGAVAIGFQDTPLGPNTAITDALKDELQQAAMDSTQFVALAQLPTSDPFVEFDVPPPAAIHWQIVVVGLRDTERYLDQSGGNSPIYYGFNLDALGNPTFLSARTVSDAPIDVVMKRACVVSVPPNGCAQYKPDRTLVITPALEIVGVYLDGSLSNLLPPAVALPIRSAANVTGAMGTLAAIPGIGTATSIRIDTTHQLSPANAGNAICMGASAANLYGSGPGNAGTSTCSIESYTTNF